MGEIALQVRFNPDSLARGLLSESVHLSKLTSPWGKNTPPCHARAAVAAAAAVGAAAAVVGPQSGLAPGAPGGGVGALRGGAAAAAAVEVVEVLHLVEMTNLAPLPRTKWPLKTRQTPSRGET